MNKDWMECLADAHRQYTTKISELEMKTLVSGIKRSVRRRRTGRALAFAFPVLALVLLFTFSTPPSIFELYPEPEREGSEVLIGGGPGSKEEKPVHSDSTSVKPRYLMSGEEKVAVTLDSIRCRYGMKVTVPRGCKAEYIDGGGFWMPNESMGGRWSSCFWAEIAIASRNEECIFLFDHTYFYNPRKIAIERKTGNKFGKRREILWVFRGIKKWNTRSEKDFPADFRYKEYLSELPASMFGADTVYTYKVPEGRTTFCYSFPGDTAYIGMKRPKSRLESMHQERFPVLRRYFFIKEGHITYSVLAMMTERADAHLPRYEKMLAKVIHYDPTLQYEDLSWYLTPEAEAIYRHRQDSIRAEAKKIQDRIKALKGLK